MEASKSHKWYSEAVLSNRLHKHCQVQGSHVAYMDWPCDTARADLCFIHGSGAHGYWWDHFVPFFAKNYSLLVPDLSGMGQSEHRGFYSVDIFAEEIQHIHLNENRTNNNILIGHSLGGFVALRALHNYPDIFKAAIIIDSPVGPPEKDWEFNKDKSPIKPKKIYGSREDALARFRLIPPQPCEETEILNYIAEKSITEYKNGYSWKYDDKLFTHFEMGNNPKVFQEAVEKVSLIYGAKSHIVTGHIKEYMIPYLKARRRPVYCQEESYHHVIIDRPMECIHNLQKILGNL